MTTKQSCEFDDAESKHTCTATVQPYHYEVIKAINDESFDMLNIYAHDKDNVRYLIHISDFGNTVYIDLDSTMEWGPKNVNILVDYLTFCLGNHAFYSHKTVQKKTLYYYQAEKRPFLRVKFKSSDAARHCRNLIKNPRFIKDLNKKTAISLAVLEADISLDRKFCTNRGILYTDWINIQGTNTLNRVSRYKDMPELDVSYHSVSKCTDPLYLNIQINMTIFTFDLECYSDNVGKFPNAFHGPDEIFMISVTVHKYMQYEGAKKYLLHTVEVNDNDKPVERIKYKTENDLINGFVDLIVKTNPAIITGYNILGFDIPYIYNRYTRTGAPFPASGITVLDSGKLLNRYNHFFGDTQQLQSSGRIFLDVMQQAQCDNPSMSSYSLNNIGAFFLQETKHDVDHIYMFKAFDEYKNNGSTDMISTVAYYCEQDTDLTVRLFEKFSFQSVVIGRASSLGINPEDVPAGSSEKRSISLLYNKARSSHIVLNHRVSDPKANTYIEGGYVSDPIRGTHKDVACTDFNSLYPSIIMWKNICFTTLEDPENPVKNEDDITSISFVQSETVLNSDQKRKVVYTTRWVKDSVCTGILPSLVRELVRERKESKKKLKTAKTNIEYIMADQRQLGLKIAANALYGFLGMQKFGRYPLIEGARTICGVGRNSIVMCADYMRDKYGCTIIYGDTDSVMFKYPNNPTTKEVIAMATKHAVELSKLFGEPMNMELEKVMFMISRMKKNYAYIVADSEGRYDTDSRDKVVIKGMVPTRRDNCKMLRTLFVDCLMARFNNDTEKQQTAFDVFTMILNTAKAVKAGQVQRDDLVISGSIQKEYNSETAMMAVFSREYELMGKSIQPGRVEYIVVKEREKNENIGKRMRLMDPSMIETCDPDYYLHHMLYKPIDDLFEVLYPDLPLKPITVAGKKMTLMDPAKAIVHALTESTGDIRSVVDFWKKHISEYDSRVKYENTFFVPRRTLKS